jgi:hypothetical protein
VNKNLHDQSTDTRNVPQINNIIEFNSYELSPTMIVDDNVVELYQIEEPRTKKQRLDDDENLTPISIMVVDTNRAVHSQRLLKVLFDPGSTKTLIHCGCLPKHCKLVAIETAQPMCTIAGNGSTKEMVVL